MNISVLNDLRMELKILADTYLASAESIERQLEDFVSNPTSFNRGYLFGYIHAARLTACVLSTRGTDARTLYAALKNIDPSRIFNSY